MRTPKIAKSALQVSALVITTLFATTLGGPPASAETTSPLEVTNGTGQGYAAELAGTEQVAPVDAFAAEVKLSAGVVKAARIAPDTLDYDLALTHAGANTALVDGVVLGWLVGGGLVLNAPPSLAAEATRTARAATGRTYAACSGVTDYRYRAGILVSYNLRIRLNSCDLNLLRALLGTGAAASAVTGFILTKIPTIPTAALGILASIAGYMGGLGVGIISACGYRNNGANFYAKVVVWCTPQ